MVLRAICKFSDISFIKWWFLISFLLNIDCFYWLASEKHWMKLKWHFVMSKAKLDKLKQFSSGLLSLLLLALILSMNTFFFLSTWELINLMWKLIKSEEKHYIDFKKRVKYKTKILIKSIDKYYFHLRVI